MTSRAPQTGDEIRTASIGLRFKPSMKAELERLARAEARTLNSYVERALEAHIAARRRKGKRR